MPQFSRSYWDRLSESASAYLTPAATGRPDASSSAAVGRRNGVGACVIPNLLDTCLKPHADALLPVGATRREPFKGRLHCGN